MWLSFVKKAVIALCPSWTENIDTLSWPTIPPPDEPWCTFTVITTGASFTAGSSVISTSMFDAEAVAAALSVKFVLSTIADIVVPSGIPAPTTLMPTP